MYLKSIWKIKTSFSDQTAPVVSLSLFSSQGFCYKHYCFVVSSTIYRMYFSDPILFVDDWKKLAIGINQADAPSDIDAIDF